MKKTIAFILVITAIIAGCVNQSAPPYQGLPDDLLHSKTDVIGTDTIIYHPVHTDQNGNILPWFSSNPGESYDQTLKLVWSFWNKMELDSNGIKYYLNHQVWKKNHDMRGLGGDQFQMALSSWDLYYNYSGDESVMENMKFLADYYLAHSLSKPDCVWPDLPYPYNMVIHSGEYDGDMILGKDILQPDKAGSFGYELVHLFKKTGDERYLDAAVKIANTLAAKVVPGDGNRSPWPFKVNAITGETGIITDIDSWHVGMDADIKKTAANAKKSDYTSNWTGSLNMFTELIALKKGNTDAYKNAFDLTINWLKTYPAKTNKWGPFFEDVPKWSDTQINAITYAMYIMEHPELDPNWKKTVNNIFSWVYTELGNEEYKKYGVICINEQTAYRVPGNSHSSRLSSMELTYWENTGDTTYVRNAVRKLNWATYMVDVDGNRVVVVNCKPSLSACFLDDTAFRRLDLAIA